MSYVMFVHIAGQVVDGVQRCTRCGVVLIDSSGAMSMDNSPMSYWQDGAFIGMAGICTVMLSRDAAEDDEVPCGRVQ